MKKLSLYLIALILILSMLFCFASCGGDNDTDHSREFVPLLVYSKSEQPKNLGTVKGFTLVSKIVTSALGVEFTPDAPDTSEEG